MDNNYKACFFTSIVNLPPAYRGKLRIPTFVGNYNNNLQNIKRGLEIEVNEMICLWEALFPDDQNSFQLHQIMDLVSSIPLHGSMLYAWSELLKNARKILLKHTLDLIL